ncbi:hypothetical protein NQ317_011825, partial [Molorchus minor]
MIIQELGDYLSSPLREKFGNFTNFMMPQKDQLNTRFEFCIKESRNRFPRVAELEFSNVYANQEKIQHVLEMIANIEDQFIVRIEAADWIDNQTKEIAVNKVKNIVEVLGHHKLDFNKNVLDKFIGVIDVSTECEPSVYEFKG